MTARRQRRLGPAATRRRYLWSAIVGLVLLALLIEYAFSGDPFAGGYELRARVTSSNQLRPGDPVRIAGLDVGRVEGVDRGAGGTSVLRMRIERTEQPIRADATITIRPRLFLEGGFAVALSPGTPGTPSIRPGSTIPEARSARPVQLDQVLSSLDHDVRRSLRGTIATFQRALGSGGDPSAVGGAIGFRRSMGQLNAGVGDLARVLRALQGQRPGDLTAAIRHGGELSGQLAADPASLAGLVRSTARVTSVLAGEDGALRSGVRQLDLLLRSAPDDLRRLDAALPPLRRLASAARPTLRALPGTAPAIVGLLRQAAAASRPAELPALLRALDPVLAIAPDAVRQLRGALPLADAAGRCLATQVLPVLEMKVPDGALSTGDPVWLELLHMGAGLSSTSPGFDGNGSVLRLGVALGEQSLEGILPGIGQITGTASGTPVGSSPYPNGIVELPFRPDARCDAQPLPVLSKRTRGTGLPAGVRVSPIPARPATTRSTGDLRAMLRSLLGPGTGER